MIRSTRPSYSARTSALRGHVLLVSLLACGFLLASSMPGVGQERTIPINQKRIRIEDLVKRVGEATERTILFSDELRGTVSIVAKRPVSLDEAWAIMDSALSMLGFSLLPSTVGQWRIAKVAEAVGESPFRESVSGDSDAFVTTLIPLRVANLQDVLKVIEPLSGSRVTLVPYEQTNSLIASGSERAIARLTVLADELDQVEEQTLRLRVLRYRDVVEVESLVESFLESRGVAGRGLQVWSDARTNSLVVRGDSDGVERVIGFVDGIDQPVEGGGSIRILRVLHRDPEEVADLIRTFSDPSGSATNPSASSESATVLSGADFSISVDARSRSLVVRAEPRVHRAIRDLLEILDVQPELIAIDVTVSELRTPKNYALAFGFQLPFSTGNDSSDLFGLISSEPAIGAAVPPSLFGQIRRDSGVSFQTTDGTGAVVTVPILQTATIAASDFHGTNEVLIQPSLVVTAGDQHEIFVGRNIPIPVTEDGGITDGNSSGGLGPTLARTTRFDRRDIGTRLGIEVRAGREGKIQLDLELELSRIDPLRAGLGGDPRVVGPSFVDQTVTVRAMLEDGENAILAMNRDVKETKIASGVPFLRDLPLIGWAFRSTGDLSEDVRLIVSARARRVSNPGELVADTIRRRLAFERRSARDSTMPLAEGSPFAVRVTTRLREDDAEAIAESLSLEGYLTRTHRWTISGTDYYDVYVIEMDSMAAAAELASELSSDGWLADIALLPTRS